MRSVNIGDKFEATEGTVLLSGIEALVRLFLTQRRLDAQRGLSTALFVSGYEGSPLGGLDQQMMRSDALLRASDIVFVPGMNEELAATAVGGTQLTGEVPGRRVDGVVGFWYGKNPGLDRAADAIRHASMSGTSPLGGAVALIGDDPSCKSSTLPSSCEQMARALAMPVFTPSSVADIVTLGLHAVALSRHCGLWTAMRIVADIADATATVEVSLPGDLAIPEPDLDRLWRPRTLIGPGSLEAERDLVSTRLPRVADYAEAAGLNRAVTQPARTRLAVLASGLAYAATVRALADLGLGPAEVDKLGLRLVKIDLPWPLDPAALRRMVDGADEVLVVEDKAPVVEEQLKAALYHQAHQPLVSGKAHPDGSPCFDQSGAVSSTSAAAALARLLREKELPARARHLVDRHNAPAPVRIDLAPDSPPPARTPYFCSGCPHNLSTRADDEQLVGLGIGCHIMAAFDDVGRGQQIGMTQMGGEGAQWIGMAPFTSDRHYTQNMGDGTFFHSGSLAVRAAVAAGATMTFKILYNDAVAMTGGQTPIGRVGVPELTHWLAMEGVQRVIVTTPDPGEFARATLHRSAKVVHRDALADVVAELAAVDGVTALIHHDPCAAEERRLRHKGVNPPLREGVWINHRVCEGCGDCAEQSSCMSLVHIDTDFGTKMEVHQGSCNLDKSCVRGECPSFIIAKLPSRPARTPARQLPRPPERLPDPPHTQWDGETVIRMPGIGGTGVVTASRIVQMAAHLAGLHAAGIDQTGLSQKGGPVTSDVRLSRRPIDGDIHASPGGADLLLGFDLLGAAGDDALTVCAPARTVAVVNVAETPTAGMLRHQESAFPLAASMLSRISRATRAGDMVRLDAQRMAEELTGDHQAANLVLVGAALQAGLLPFGAAELDEAVRLNGVDVEASQGAVRWGRAAVALPADVAAALDSPMTGTPAPPARGEPARHDGWPTLLDEVVGLRAAELEDFQSRRLARSYRVRVEEVARRERDATGDDALPITVAFAHGLFALTAVKDEYEVARLHLLPAQREAFARAFPGAQPVYLLKPPLLASLGLRRKIKLSRTAVPAFRILRSARRLRGTPFDPFGRTRERREERAELTRYLQLVDTALTALRESTSHLVLALVDSANDVHGYSHVRAASRARAGERVAQQWAELRETASAPAGSLPAAG